MRLEVPSTLLLLLTTVAIGTAHAQKREHDAHEHGHGALNIVIADGEMLVEMEVPGVHVAGFEHVPKTDAERAAVDAVVKRMRDGERSQIVRLALKDAFSGVFLSMLLVDAFSGVF